MVIFVMQCSNVVAVARPILEDASLHPARCSGCAYHARPAAPRVPSALRLQPQSQPPRVTLRRSTCAVHVSNVPMPELGSVMKSCKNFLNLSCNLLLRVSFPAFLRTRICKLLLAVSYDILIEYSATEDQINTKIRNYGINRNLITRQILQIMFRFQHSNCGLIEQEIY